MSMRQLLASFATIIPVLASLQGSSAAGPANSTADDSPVADVRVLQDEGDVHLVGRDEWWFDPQSVKSIELHLKSIGETDVRARCDKRRWTFRHADEAKFELAMHEGVRSDWRQTVEMRIEYHDGADWRTVTILMARPAELRFHGCCAAMLLQQRSATEVPGSSGYLTVHLGDITRGQVGLTLRTADGRRLIDNRSVREGDAYEFNLKARQFTLYVEELDNQLFGPDSATLEVSRLPAAEVQQVWWLLSRIRNADAVFVRNGREYRGAEAAEHLRDKLWGEPNVATCDDFIDKVGSRSALTGTPYTVRLSDGRTLPAGEWLRNQLAMKTEKLVQAPKRP
jgi:hypothetical protein